MEKKKIENILKNTNEFYKNHAEEFSKTRENPWPGWLKLLNVLKGKFTGDKNISVLDLGCGNARFYRYIKENLGQELEYLGIDNNDYMMIEAIMRYPKAKFISSDVLKDPEKIEGKYDLVVAFGLTHHIPGSNYRLKWFAQILSKVKTKGLVVFTFWNLHTDKRFEKAIEAKDLEENDFYYGWGDSDDRRYVHIYDEEEIRTISQLFKDKGFKLIKTYDSDGKNNRMNTYIILQAI
jgi:SAM-dependent methyltransferase